MDLVHGAQASHRDDGARRHATARPRSSSECTLPLTGKALRADGSSPTSRSSTSPTTGWCSARSRRACGGRGAPRPNRRSSCRTTSRDVPARHRLTVPLPPFPGSRFPLPLSGALTTEIMVPLQRTTGRNAPLNGLRTPGLARCRPFPLRAAARSAAPRFQPWHRSSRGTVPAVAHFQPWHRSSRGTVPAVAPFQPRHDSGRGTVPAAARCPLPRSRTVGPHGAHSSRLGR